MGMIFTASIPGSICRICGGLMIQTGSCQACMQCGESTGCGRHG